jgi:UDP-N-acetylmuramoylalanine--D-glutamate ligase
MGLDRIDGATGLRKAAGTARAVAVAVAGSAQRANALAALRLTRAIDLPIAAAAGADRVRRLAAPRAEGREIDGVAFYDDSKGTNVGAPWRR